MKYIGVDFHKHFSYVTILDEKGQEKFSAKVENDRESLREFFEKQEGAKVVVESTANWYYFYEALQGLNLQIKLSNPYKTRAIASAKIKTDKIDSRMLANLLRAELIPESYVPPQHIRDLRELLRFRAALVKLRTRLKNTVWSILFKNGYDLKTSDIFGGRAIKKILELPLRDIYKKEIERYIKIYERLKKQIKEVEEEIEAKAETNEYTRLLLTIKGVGHYSALLIYSEIGDIERFQTAKQLISYAGLAPSVHASGGKYRYGPITKQGSKWLRWILVEISYQVARHNKKFAKYYIKLRKRKPASVAKIAVARKLTEVIFYMLKNKTPYNAE